MPAPSVNKYGIQDIWESNLEEEFDKIRDIVDAYPFLGMDTEFPGVVARPIGEFKTSTDYLYNTLKCNVDILKIIQLGLTFTNERGEKAPGISTWQFNFKFSLSEDMYAQDSMELLQRSGIQFKRHEEDGIDANHFAELFITSGIVLSDNVTWLSFHSGYDFAYMLKLLTCTDLPKEESDFFDMLRLYFPSIYDIKYLMKSCKSLKGGLQDIADIMQLERIGPQHQAGSDSMLTADTFFKMKQLFFEDDIDETIYGGHLFGLSAPYTLTTENSVRDNDNS